MNEKRRIILIKPRGFCAGVERAITIVDKALEKTGAPLYVHHEIVHNRRIIENFKNRGVVFSDDLESVPDQIPLIFSAHGVSPDVRDRAAQKSLQVVDATCPLVTKVHIEARKFAREGYHIFFIGHRTHAEAVGVVGEAPDSITVIESLSDIDAIAPESFNKTACLMQTTMSQTDTASMLDKLRIIFPDLRTPPSSDICYATTNRQNAVRTVAPDVDLMLILGSSNSSNSRRLQECAAEYTRAYLIDNCHELNPDWITQTTQTIGISSGASVPDDLVHETILVLKERFDFQNVDEYTIGMEESTGFQLPSELDSLGR